jgi:Flp pilus assembly pilin Flp
MIEFVNRIRARYGNRDRGATAVEYALLLILIVGVMVVLFYTIGNETQYRLRQACNNIEHGTSVTCP